MITVINKRCRDRPASALPGFPIMPPTFHDKWSEPRDIILGVTELVIGMVVNTKLAEKRHKTWGGI